MNESPPAARLRNAVLDEVGKVVIGQEETLRLVLAAVLSHGHALLVGVPGLAKTLTVKCLAQALGLSFKRIQFTPDLMPSDISGTTILHEDTPGRREFRFVQGPIFANLVLADEINRTPPKTQAALLEAMQERQVTVGNATYPLPAPFFVIATQNPIEQEGTYPLPEAQLDRFMFEIDIGYPPAPQEEEIYRRTTQGAAPAIRPAVDAGAIAAAQDGARAAAVSNLVVSYVTRLVRATRPKEKGAPDFIRRTVEWGAGPRAGQHLILGAKAFAAMDGRPYVTCADIRAVAVPVLRHRIAPSFQAQMEGLDSARIVQKLLETTPEPKVTKYEAAE